MKRIPVTVARCGNYCEAACGLLHG